MILQPLAFACVLSSLTEQIKPLQNNANHCSTSVLEKLIRSHNSVFEFGLKF